MLRPATMRLSEMTLTKLCDTDSVKPGEMIEVDVDSLPPLAVYNVDGEFFVTSNICTHSIALLTDGYLEGDVIECPLHGGSFSVKTGEPMSFPCEEALKTYEVKIEDGGVYIEAP